MAGYVFPSSAIETSTENTFGKIYHGEILEAANQLSALAVPMDRMTLPSKRNLRLSIATSISYIFFGAGLAWSGYSTLVSQTWYNILILAVYLFLTLYIFTSSIIRIRSFGVITDNKTGKPITGANIYLVDSVTGQAVENRTTDETGRYQMFTSKGDYKIKVLHPAFDPTEKPLTVKGESNLITISFKLNKQPRKTSQKNVLENNQPATPGQVVS